MPRGDETTKPPTSAAKLAANRRNARRSTGPRTAEGRARSARNATRHGLLATAPVIEPVEDAEAWQEHRDATLAALAPQTHVDSILAERVALLSWRLARVARYETEALSASQATVEGEVRRQRERDARLSPIGPPVPLSYVDPCDAEQVASYATERARLVERFAAAVADGKLDAVDTEAARAALEEVNRIIAIEHDEHEETDFQVWSGTGSDAWALICGLAKTDESDPHELVEEARCNAVGHASQARRALSDIRQRVRSLRADRSLSEAVTNRVARYEAHLERCLYRTVAIFTSGRGGRR